MSFRTGDFRTGDFVKGQTCPKCLSFEVVYNGNYFCTHCDWAMGRDVPRIVKAYLIQCRAGALAKGDTERVADMDFYLHGYADEVKA